MYLRNMRVPAYVSLQKKKKKKLYWLTPSLFKFGHLINILIAFCQHHDIHVHIRLHYLDVLLRYATSNSNMVFLIYC